MLLLLTSITWAQDTPPLRINLNTGGMMITGNLNQLQLNGGGMISYSQENHGNDTVISGYRIWMQPAGMDERIKIGDDLHIADIGYYYIKPRIYLQAFGNYSTSQLHQIDERYMAGFSVGYTPIREKQKLFRGSIGGFWEYTSYPFETFNIEVDHDENIRALPRIGFISNGWYRVPNNQNLSFRYLAWFYIDPLNIADYRYRANAEVNFNLTKTVSLRLSTTYEYSSVVMEGLSVYDLRSNAGLGFSFPPKKKK